MPRPRKIPTYRLHKPGGQAIVTVRLPGGERRDIYLGERSSTLLSQWAGGAVGAVVGTGLLLA